MLCVRCKKNQATKTYERLKNGKKEMEYYCLACYHHAFAEMDESFAGTACPYCGTTVSEIKKRNLVGCAHCYPALAHVLQPMIQKMQGASVHIGVKPDEGIATQRQKRIAELQVLAEKCRAEQNDEATMHYEEQIARLVAGHEEEYVWDSRLLSKQS